MTLRFGGRNAHCVHIVSVFQVETVGDCYVAVCGVPDANDEHAVVMAAFARKCLEEFYKVIKGLEMKLGPDTGELAIR